MSTLWYSVVIVSIFYISWSAFGKTKPLQEEHKKAKLHYVNAGVCCCLFLLCFMFILYASTYPVGSGLPFVTFLTWAATLFVILRRSHLSTFVRRVSRGFIITAPLLFFLYPGGLTVFLADIDRFAIEVLQRASVVDVTSSETQSKGKDTQKGSPDGPQPSSEQKSSTEIEGTKDDKSSQARGYFRVSDLIKAIFFFIQAFLVSTFYGKMWHYRRVAKQTEKPAGNFENESIDQAILILSLAISSWIAFVMLGFDTLSVSIFSGLVAISVSVALKDLLSNFLAGILLLWGKSVKHGDVVAIDKNRVGEVSAISLRHMEIKDRNDITYLIPHSQLLNTVIENWTRDGRNVRLKLDVGVSYNSDIEKVKDVMRSACFDVQRVLKKPLPNPLIMSLDDSAIHFQLRFRIADPENGIRNVMSEVYERLLERFGELDIEIPFPQREIRVKSSIIPTEMKDAFSITSDDSVK